MIGFHLGFFQALTKIRPAPSSSLPTVMSPTVFNNNFDVNGFNSDDFVFEVDRFDSDNLNADRRFENFKDGSRAPAKPVNQSDFKSRDTYRRPSGGILNYLL
jgi:hypothetical protein